MMLETTGYPLSPGTAAPCSGECFGCGCVPIPHHRKIDCPGPAVPTQESRFRSLCAKYLRQPPAPVNAVFNWMDFGTPDDMAEDFGEGSTA